MRLSLNVLGRLEIIWETQIVTTLTLRKSQALLIYLALEPGPHDRSRLAGLLWGELPERNARRNLRHALHTLRSALDPDLLESDRLTIGLNSDVPCRVDALAFEEALTQAERQRRAGEPEAATEHLEAAVTLYQGDFLAGFDVSDCLAFEEWATGQRAHLRVQFLEALDGLVTYWTRRGAHARALDYARLLLDHEPLSEKAHRQLMTLLALTGQRSAALKQYGICRRILLEELGLEPLEETKTLYRTIQQSDISASGAGPGLTQQRGPIELPFVGREKEHAALIRTWESARRGDGVLTLVEGEAGVGKTRLVEEVLRYTETQGATTLRGRCYEFGGSVPYQPIAEALRGYLRETEPALSPIWLTELARLLPELREARPDLPEAQRISGEVARQRLFEAVARLLSSLCDAQTARCLFFDDLHWADQPTLDLLHYLVRQLTAAPIWFVGTYRPEEVDLSHPLTRLRQGLSRDHQVRRLTLAPLSGEAVRAAADALVGAQRGADLGDFLHRESEGNAFILVETVNALEEEGALRAGDAHLSHDAAPPPTWVWTGAPATETLPPTVQDIVLQRVGRLSKPAQRLLTLAAVIGQRFDPALLQAAGRDSTRAEESLDEWLARRLVRPQPRSRQYDFSHDKIRAVVYQTTPETERRRLHRRVGQTLEQRYASHVEEHAAALAYHFERAGVAEKALTYLPLAAAQAAAVYANEQALDYDRRALALCSPADERRWRILLHQADVLGLIGQYDAAIQACRQVIDGGQAGWQARAYDGLAEIYRIQRNYDPARRCAQESERLIRQTHPAQPETPTSRQAQALQTLGEIEREQGNLARAQELFEAALAIYQQTGDRHGLAHCYKGLGDLLSARTDYAHARERYEQAITIFQQLQDKPSTSLCLRSIGIASWRQRAYGPARQASLESMEICQAIGDRQGEAASLNMLGLVAIVQGDYDETQRRLQASVAIYRELGLEKRTASGLHNLGISYMESGDMTASRRSLEQALEINHAVGSPRDQALDLGWLGKLHWLLKDYAVAIDYLDRALALDEQIGGGEEEDWHTLWRAAVACESGDLSGARHYLQKSRELAAQGSTNLNEHDLSQWQAALHLAEGDVETARRLIRQARVEAEALKASNPILGEIVTLQARIAGADPAQNDADTRARFEEALTLLPDAVPTQYLRAMALYHYGTYLRENGEHDETEVSLAEARELFKRIGVPPEFMQR